MAGKSEALFAELAASAKEGDHERALATTEKLLQALPNDPDVVASKVVCLVHLGRHEEVIKFTESKPEFQFERAYAMYRLKMLPEALRIVRSLPRSQRTQMLEAQILYRLEEYAAASKIFQELYAKSGNNQELRANLLASYVAQGALKEAMTLASSSKDANSYEFTYNVACAHIEAGNLSAAIEALDAAEKICKANLTEEGLSEEEMNNEMAVLRVQKAVVLQMQAKEEEALKLYTDALGHKPSDAVVTAVAANNIVTLRHDHDLFDSLKKIKSATTPATEGKLSTAQKRAIHINHCLVLLKMNKADQCKELVQTLRTQMPQSYLPTVIEAAVLFKDKKNASKAEELLSAYATAHPRDSDYVQLCLAQIAFARDDIKGVTAALSRVDSLQHRPALVATLVKLHMQAGDVAAANDVLNAAVAHWSKNKEEVRALRLLQRESINFKMTHRLYAEATKELTAMAGEKNVKEAEIIPQLVLAYARFQPATAESWAKKLPALARTQVDVAALENAPAYRLGAPVKEESKETTAAAAAAAGGAGGKVAAAKTKGVSTDEKDKKKKKKRKRKQRLPKNFDPNKAPDPERWLPKRERYANRKSKKKGAVLRGPQGATGSPAAEGSKDASSKPEPPTAEGAPKISAAGGKGGKAAGKAEAKAKETATANAPPAAVKPAAAEPSSPAQGGKRKGKK